MNSKPSSVNFILLKITTDQFAVIGETIPETTNIRLGVNFHFAADHKQKVVIVFSNFTFEADEKPFIIIEAGCHFLIKEDAWDQMLDISTNILTIPKSIMGHLAMITVGTTRGILHAKTENTVFNGFIIPTVNVVEMIKDDITLQCCDENVKSSICGIR